MSLKYLINRYKFSLILLIISIVILCFNNALGISIFNNVKSIFFQMLGVLPPVMIILTLMDVWVPREYFLKYMGEESGIKDILITFLISFFAAGPMYAAFPFTSVLLKKGVKFSNIIIFLNAWCVTKASTLLFEVTALGYKFTLARLIINIPGIIIMGYLVDFLLKIKKLPSGN